MNKKSIFEVDWEAELPEYTRKMLKNRKKTSVGARIIIGTLLLAFLYFGGHVVLAIIKTYGG